MPPVKEATVKLPNGKKARVISADQIKVGAYRRMKRFDALLEESQDDPSKEMELLDTCFETLQYLLPEVSESDLDDCTLEQMGTLLQESMTAMSRGTGMEVETPSEGDSKAPKARPRKRKTSK